MKDELELAIREWLLTLKYNGAQIADSVVCAQTNKPEGNSTIVVSFKQPETSFNKSTRNNVYSVNGTGELVFIYPYNTGKEGGLTLAQAEQQSNKVPDIVVDTLIGNPNNNIAGDPTLGGRIPGMLEPGPMQADFYANRNTEGLFYFITQLIVNYKGPWIPAKTV